MCNNVGVLLPFCILLPLIKCIPVISDHTVLVSVKERPHFALFVDMFMKCGNKYHLFVDHDWIAPKVNF